MQCNFFTDILDLVYLRFAKNVQIMHLHVSTEEPASSWTWELFGEVGGYVPEYFLRISVSTFAVKKLLRKISSKNLTAGVKDKA